MNIQSMLCDDAVMSSTPLPPPAEPPRGAEITREKLLQATHDLLIERRGADPSVSQICERAGVQVAMVSYCFGGKTQLLEALVERTTKVFLRELEQLAGRELPPEEKLRRHIAAVIRNFFRYPYSIQLSERLSAGDAATILASTFAEPMLDFYRGLLADSGFRDVDPTLLFFSVVGMCEFLFAARSWLETGAGEKLDEQLIKRFSDHTVELLLHGIAGGGG